MFTIKRVRDELLRPVDSGVYTLEPLALTRRAINLSGTGSYMFLELSAGSISSSAMVSLIPLDNSDYRSQYTVANGNQIDVFGRSHYSVNTSSYIHDPYDTVMSPRYAGNFSGLTFALAPLFVSSNASLRPMTIGSNSRIFWDSNTSRPMWMYWDPVGALWRRLSTACGTSNADTLAYGANGIVNITAPV
jgi:hypothetical protein